jgi:hypothetical protein
MNGGGKADAFIQALARNEEFPVPSPKKSGRPRGSRNKLAEDFLADLCADWKKHGTEVIADVRKMYPAVFLRTVASLVPRDQPSPVQCSEFEHLSDLELLELLQEQARALVEGSDQTDGNIAPGRGPARRVRQDGIAS